MIENVNKDILNELETLKNTACGNERVTNPFSGARLSVVVISSQDDLSRMKALFGMIPDEYEIIMCVTIPHTGVTDEIATVKEKANNKVFAEWRYHDPGKKNKWLSSEFRFDSARNAAKAIASSPWILSLDMDEYLSPKAWHEIANIINSVADENNAGGFYINVTGVEFPSDDELREGLVLQSAQMRLFRRDRDIFWEGAAHEQIANSVTAAGYDIGATRIILEHDGYDNRDKGKMNDKAKRNFYLLVKETRDNENISEYHERKLIETACKITDGE